MLKNPEGNVAISMKGKEALVSRSVFPKPPKSLGPGPVVLPGIAHKGVTEVEVANALMSQSATKLPVQIKSIFRSCV